MSVTTPDPPPRPPGAGELYVIAGLAIVSLVTYFAAFAASPHY